MPDWAIASRSAQDRTQEGIPQKLSWHSGGQVPQEVQGLGEAPNYRADHEAASFNKASVIQPASKCQVSTTFFIEARRVGVGC